PGAPAVYGFWLCAPFVRLLSALNMVTMERSFFLPRISVFLRSCGEPHKALVSIGDEPLLVNPTPRRLGPDLAPTSRPPAPTSFRHTRVFIAAFQRRSARPVPAFRRRRAA